MMYNRNKHTILFTILLAVVITSCERRELYVYGDEYTSVELNVDWRQYSATDPDGMTVWFYSLDNPSHAPYRTTSANVRKQKLYLPGGKYHGVVVDYSPEEYSRQQFLGMDRTETARVEATPASYQPDQLIVSGEGVPDGVGQSINSQLYSEQAWTPQQTDRTALNGDGGLYVTANQPEQMALDTLLDKEIAQGEYGDYIPWKHQNDYQSTLTIRQLYSEPQSIIWKLRIRVWIHSGFNSLWQTQGSLSGLSDGHFLAQHINTDRACLMSIDDWETQRTGTNEGYISATITTFGLRPSTLLPDRQLHGNTGDTSGNATRAGETEPDYLSPEWYWYYTGNCLPADLRLNLAFLLRDHATLCTYRFDVGGAVVSYDNQLVLRIDLDADFPVDLPDVDAYNGAGFGADVTPWDDLPPVDVGF